jgi:hypothetical protein
MNIPLPIVVALIVLWIFEDNIRKVLKKEKKSIKKMKNPLEGLPPCNEPEFYNRQKILECSQIPEFN